MKSLTSPTSKGFSKVAKHAPSLVLNCSSPGFFVGMAVLRTAMPTKNPGEERSEEQTEEKKKPCEKPWVIFA